jgi:FkbM family methyltransferase
LAQDLDSPARHRRSLWAHAKAVGRPSNYESVLMAARCCVDPVDLLWRYVRNAGSYPSVVKMRTPTGTIDIQVYSPDDIQTIHEIYLRGDYKFDNESKIIVDFGSNIGISTLYFLSRNTEAFVYCFEPLPQNIERLKLNLGRYADRYRLKEVAVGERNEMVSFGWEPTGRYGGIGRATGRTTTVPCVDSNAELRDIVARHGRIDLLKIDIETLESIVTERIPAEIISKIGNLVVEYPFRTNPLANTHRMERINFVTKFHGI